MTAGVVLLVLAAWCGFGLLAAFEPGVAAGWRWAYGAGVVVLGGAGLALLQPRPEAVGR